ncbi:twin-arginine translocase TatA/TatE family subunit [Melioribacteraceae bacterium 4301-Me]|uniref:twin-arginine translocase TatA/TatE family subunit n=1 Tax=Pyranulibacter aquaticus TaxID=3163344 RepID=UPI00359B35BD
MFENIGPMELILIFLVILIFFGGKKIPEIAKGMGQGIRLFKKALQGTDEEEKPSKIEQPKIEEQKIAEEKKIDEQTKS